jgi:hypothetical protein
MCKLAENRGGTKGHWTGHGRYVTGWSRKKLSAQKKSNKYIKIFTVKRGSVRFVVVKVALGMDFFCR